MKCSNCSNIITSFRECVFCGNKCCCFVCLEQHYLTIHKNRNNSSKSKDKNKEQKEENKISPYLVSGIMNRRVKYNSKYRLENFTPVMERGEIKTIGSGSFGQVYLALNIIDKKVYAIKHMDKNKLIEILHTLKGIYQEIDIQSRIDHPNIVKILYTDEDEDSFDLVMEYADNGSLFHYIRKNKGLNEYKTFQLFIQVVNAINFLHENDLIHRDIKPENILLFTNNNKRIGNKFDYIVKLCDFGWCVKLNGQERDTFCGTTEYMSPELVNHKEYSKEVDVWSLGILLYEMIHGYSPFRPNKPKFNEDDVFENIKKHNLKFVKKISEECKKLILHLLASNKNKRYTISDIYHSKFVKFFESINYCIPKKFNSKEKLSNKKQELNDEIIEENDIHEIHEIRTKNNNNFISKEINDENNKYNNKTPIFEIYNELKKLDENNVKKVLTKQSTYNEILKSFSKKSDNNEIVSKGFKNMYNLSFINNIKMLNSKIDKKRLSHKSENDMNDKKNHSLQNDFKYFIERSISNVKIVRTISKKSERSLGKEIKNLLIINNDKNQNYNSYVGYREKINNINKDKKNITKSISIINKEKTKGKVNKIEFSNKKKNMIKIVHKNIKFNNNLHPLETNGKIPFNSEKYNTKKSGEIAYSNYNLKDSLSYKNMSQRLKTNTNISNANNSISNKIKKEMKQDLKEKNKNNNLIKNNTINKEKIFERKKLNKNQELNEYLELKSFNQNNSKMDLKKLKSINDIKKIYSSKQTNIYKDINYNFYENPNNENIKHDTIKLELSPDCYYNQNIKKDLEIMKIKSKTNFNNQKSTDFPSFVQNPKIIKSNAKLKNNSSPSYERKIKENKKNIFKLNDPYKGQKIIHKKNISSISPKNIYNINSYKNKNINKPISKSRSSKMDKYSEKRKINSVNNKNNRINIKPFTFHIKSLSNGKSNTKKKIITTGINKNLFSQEDNEFSQMKSDRLINNKNSQSILPYNNFIFIKAPKINNSINNINNEKLIKQIKNFSPEKYINLLINNTSQNLKRLSPSHQFNTTNYNKPQYIKSIKPRNKKSFCFISRNNNKNKISQNECENIFCGSINKINNINYQSNNINNFYIINSNNINNTGPHLKQKILKKQFTEQQKEIKNIDYSKLMIPISLIEGGCVNHTFNKSKNINIIQDSNKTKSLSKRRPKLNLKYYLMKIKNKRVHSYNNKKSHLKYKEKSNSKESESGIIYIDSDFSDNGEKNTTPKKNKDNVKINPIKLLGDFKKEYTIFHRHNRNSRQISGIKA